MQITSCTFRSLFPQFHHFRVWSFSLQLLTSPVVAPSLTDHEAVIGGPPAFLWFKSPDTKRLSEGDGHDESFDWAPSWNSVLVCCPPEALCFLRPAYSYVHANVVFLHSSPNALVGTYVHLGMHVHLHSFVCKPVDANDIFCIFRFLNDLIWSCTELGKNRLNIDT